MRISYGSQWKPCLRNGGQIAMKIPMPVVVWDLSECADMLVRINHYYDMEWDFVTTPDKKEMKKRLKQCATMVAYDEELLLHYDLRDETLQPIAERHVARMFPDFDRVGEEE